MADSFFF